MGVTGLDMVRWYVPLLPGDLILNLPPSCADRAGSAQSRLDHINRRGTYRCQSFGWLSSRSRPPSFSALFPSPATGHAFLVVSWRCQAEFGCAGAALTVALWLLSTWPLGPAARRGTFALALSGTHSLSRRWARR
eukprot:scaffold85518_cov37-Tisochrysis_lutea.AAC.3